MIPVVALVGRPNVGKSTLFNRLTRTRDALVADQPGLTRDRQYGIGKIGDKPYVVVDTGGLSGIAEGVDALMERQVQAAIGEADHILFLMDYRAGCVPSDEVIAQLLRRTGKPVTAVVNKADRINAHEAGHDFYSIGMGEPRPISASHGQGVEHLINDVLEPFPEDEGDEEEAEHGIRIAVVGRPNVGKSTLVNRICGEERVLAYDMPGTTRDAVDVPFEREGIKYTLVDTAGVRRRARIHDMIEKFSVVKTLQAIERSNVVMLVLDAQQGVSDQDAGLAGHILDSGRGLVVAVNKWDGLDADVKDKFRKDVVRKLAFLDFARWHYISALHGTGVGEMFPSIKTSYRNATRKLSTPELTRLLEAFVEEHQPPMVQGRRIKLRYAHQGGHNPPLIIIHGNQVDRVPAQYVRYLINRFRKVLKLDGTPLRLQFKAGDNPYKNRRNKLTARQLQKKRRLMSHVKKR